jgi:hypothetical protein
MAAPASPRATQVPKNLRDGGLGTSTRVQKQHDSLSRCLSSFYKAVQSQHAAAVQEVRRMQEEQEEERLLQQVRAALRMRAKRQVVHQSSSSPDSAAICCAPLKARIDQARPTQRRTPRNSLFPNACTGGHRHGRHAAAGAHIMQNGLQAT